jgi:predicted dehydrogenase
MNGDRVRWGVLGCAAIALHKVIPAMQRSARCDVIAIASRSAERAAEAAGALGIPRSYGSYADLLADPDVEAVYIPLPNHLHAEWTRRAAEAGKHVLCEKPLAMDATEAAAMVEACGQAGVLLMEAFMYRLHPLWRRAHEFVSSGAIGELETIQAFFSYRNVDPENIRNITDYGGGALMDIGCYPINVARWFFGGEPDRVSAHVRRDATFGTDVLTSAILDFAGRQATFTCSTQIEDDQRVHLVGTAGRLVVEIPFNIPPDRPTRLLRVAGGNPPVEPDIEVIEVPTADPYGVQGDAFSAAVRDGTPVPIPPDDAVANMAVIEQILATELSADPARGR